MRRLSRRIARLLIAWRLPLLAVGVVAAVVAFMPSRELVFDRSIEAMFAPDDPFIGPYEKLKRTFGGNEIVLLVYVDDELLDPSGRGIERLADISRRVKDIPGVEDVLSLDQPLGTGIVAPDDPVAARLRHTLEGYTHGADGKTAAVICILQPELKADVPREETIARLRELAGELPSGMLAGEPVMVNDGFRYVERSGYRLGWASTILLGITIILCFRSLRWVLIPLAVVQLALLLTRATIVWSGLPLSLVSSMLTSIVTVVGIATVVHVIVRYREHRAIGYGPRNALMRAGTLLAAPVFWSCTTTAVGFASLRTAAVGPIRDFGLMMAIGSLVVIVSVSLLVPGLALLGRFDVDPKRAWGERFLDAGLGGAADRVGRRPGLLAAGMLVLAALVSAGVFRLEVESDFTKNFRSSTPIVQSYRFIENRLGGAGVWDVVVPAPERADGKFLRRVWRLENRLRDEVTVVDEQGNRVPGLTKVLSLVDLFAALTPAGSESQMLFDTSPRSVDWTMWLANLKMPALVRLLHGEDPENPGQRYWRIMLRAKERQSSVQKRALIADVRRICREEFPPSGNSPGAQVTGYFVLLTHLIDSVIRDQWLTFGIATAGIALMMVAAFGSLRLALLAVVPNVLPIVMVTGMMGWLGLKINMGAAMIAAVSVGLSIDSSIHYITAFRRMRREGRSVVASVAAAHQTVGRAMCFSTLALILGFSVLCTSEFIPTAYFGALVSLAMLGGLIGNLILLPALLELFAPR